MQAPAICGIGLTPFGRHPDRSLKQLAGAAVEAALTDAAMDKADIDMAFVANSMAAVITGQVAVVGQTILREQGFSRIPVYNIDNACASSSSALSLAVHAIRAGAARRVLVVGVEKLFSSDRALSYRALNGAADVEFVRATGIDADAESVFVTNIYPVRLEAYARDHGLDAMTLARIAEKNRRHAGLNPFAQYTKPLTATEILESRVIVEPLTALMCAPISDGASAVIVAALERGNAARRAVPILGCAVGMGVAAGESAIRSVARAACVEAGVTSADVDVAEVHDSTAFNELLAYEELGFCEPGGGATLVDEGATSLGGRIPINVSGGLESRGHPVAATGLAQVIELVAQIRGEAGPRQVSEARVGLAENAGGYAGGDTAAVAVTVLGSRPVTH